VTAALCILVPFTALAGWAFWRLSPSHGNQRAVLRFNIASSVIVLLLAVAWVVRTYIVMSPTVDSAWWPVISAMGALAIIPIAFSVAATIRNFVVFRHRV
jgi:hypothetical protein